MKNGKESGEASSRSGHRSRLRERFLQSGLDGFHDYEIVEMLFTLGTPRRDCKAAAKEAVKRFGSLRGVLEAPLEKIQEIDGIGPHSAFGIKLVQEVARKFLKDRLPDRPFYSSSQEVFDYLYHAMRDLKHEVFKVLYLDAQNRIIDTIDIAEGMVTGSSVSPREVIAGALRRNAVSLILVHNHPSGNPAPSLSDKKLTQELVFTSRLMQLKILDHIIIGDNTYFSFSAEGYIEEYETDLLNNLMRGTAEIRKKHYRT